MRCEMPLKLRHAMFVERGKWRIENPQRRWREIQTRQPHAALLASRKGMTGHVFEPAQSHFGKCMPYRLAAGRLVQRTEPGEILLSCQQALDARSMADPPQAIGRASCRERVCQYV